MEGGIDVIEKIEGTVDNKLMHGEKDGEKKGGQKMQIVGKFKIFKN